MQEADGGNDALAAASWPNGGGATGALLRDGEWSKTPLGEPFAWPQSLRTLIDTVLASRHGMMLAWGPTSRCSTTTPTRPSSI